MDVLFKIINFISSKLPGSGINYLWTGDTRHKYNHMYLSFIYDIVMHINSIYCQQNPSISRKSSHRAGEKRPVPLPNIGLNCYLNSSFQSIVACTRFMWEMKELEKRYPASKTLFVFNKILASLNEDNGDDVELSNNPILRNWNKTGEQDSFEILSYVLFQVFNELKRIYESGIDTGHLARESWTKVPLPMKLLLEFHLRCQDCGDDFRPNRQSDLALHLTVPPRLLAEQQSFTIEQLIDNYFFPEPIADCSCHAPGCQSTRITKTIVLLQPAPTTICLHVQRSFWNPIKSMMEKINEKIDFRETLWLKEDYFRADRNTPSGPIATALARIGEVEQWFQDPMENQRRHQHDERDSNTSITSNLVGGLTDTCDIVELSTGAENSSSELQSLSSVIVSTPSEIGPSRGDLEQHRQIDNSPRAVLNGWPHMLERPGTGDVGVTESSISMNTGTEHVHRRPVITDVVEHAISPPVVGDSTTTNTEVSDCYSNDYSLLRADCRIKGDVIQNSGLFGGERYCLRSVIVHFGSPESGHFICYRKCGPKWFCTNDNFVTEVSFREVQNCQAYILMYEKPLETTSAQSPTISSSLY